MRNAIIPIFLICFLGCIHSGAAEAFGSSFFQTHSLSGWQTELANSETIPFISEKLRSKFLWGARSSAGSYIFVSVTDNGNREPLTLKSLNAVISESSFSHLHPFSFTKQAVKIPLEGTNLDALVTTLKAKGSGHDFQSAQNVMTVAKTAYFPVVLERDGQVFNYLVMADFRGSADNAGDMSAFDRFYRSFRLRGSGYSFVDPVRFSFILSQKSGESAPMQARSTTDESKKITSQSKTDHPTKPDQIAKMSVVGKNGNSSQPRVDIYE